VQECRGRVQKLLFPSTSCEEALQSKRLTSQLLVRACTFEQDVKLERSAEGLLDNVEITVGVDIVWKLERESRIRGASWIAFVRLENLLSPLDNGLQDDLCTALDRHGREVGSSHLLLAIHFRQALDGPCNESFQCGLGRHASAGLRLPMCCRRLPKKAHKNIALGR